MNEASSSIEVFISYSREDEKYLEMLIDHLSMLRWSGKIKAWQNREMTAGTERADQIDEQLDKAQIILLLISSDFLASDCDYYEMKRAMQRHDSEQAVVIPVIIRPVDWRGMPFENLLSLPKGGKSVAEWKDPDLAFRDVAEGISVVVEELIANSQQAHSLRPSATTAGASPKLAAELDPFSVRLARQALKQWVSRKDSSQTLNLGWLMNKMCDRKLQEDNFCKDFRKAIEQMGMWPQVYLVRGMASDCPNSLIERLIHIHIDKYAREISDGTQGPMVHRLNKWPHGGALNDRKQILINGLFDRFAAGDANPRASSPDELSAVTFASLNTWPDKSVIVLCHPILAEQWDKMTKGLIEGYLQFWDNIGKAEHSSLQARFIIFLIIFYPHEENVGGWKSWFWKLMLMETEGRKKTIERELKEIDAARRTQEMLKQSCPTLLLDELACVNRIDVNEWFLEQPSFSEAYWEDEFKKMKLINESDCRPMAKIEPALEDILKRLRKDSEI